MSQKNQAERVFALFGGGLHSTARALGHSGLGAIQHWREAGHIPKWRHHEIFQAARRKKIKKSIVLAALSGS